MLRFAAQGTKTAKPEELGFFQRIGVLVTGVRIPRPVTDLSPADFHSNCVTLTIAGPKGIRLGGWHVKGSPGAPLWILFHGYSAEKASLVREGRRLVELGQSVLLLDFRGSGESSESYTTIGYLEAEDVASACQHATEVMGYSQWVLYGQSMGAAALLRAVDSLGIRPRAVVVEAVFDRLERNVEKRFHAMGLPAFPGAKLLLAWGGWDAGFDAFSHNPEEYARSVSCPILFLHGARDPRASREAGRRVFDAVVYKDKLWVEHPELGHEALVGHDPQLWDSGIRWLLTHLAGTKTPFRVPPPTPTPEQKQRASPTVRARHQPHTVRPTEPKRAKPGHPKGWTTNPDSAFTSLVSKSDAPFVVHPSGCLPNAHA